MPAFATRQFAIGPLVTMQPPAETWAQVSEVSLDTDPFYEDLTASAALGVVVLGTTSPLGLAVVNIRDLDTGTPEAAVPIRRICEGVFARGGGTTLRVAFLQEDPSNLLAVGFVATDRRVALALVDVVTGTVQDKAWAVSARLPNGFAMAAAPGVLALRVDDKLCIFTGAGLDLHRTHEVRCYPNDVCTSLAWLDNAILLDLHMYYADDWTKWRQDDLNKNWVLAHHCSPLFLQPHDWQMSTVLPATPAVDGLLRTTDVTLVVADGSVFALAGPTLLHLHSGGKRPGDMQATVACEMPTTGAGCRFVAATFVPGHGVLVLCLGLQRPTVFSLRRLMRTTRSTARVAWLAACAISAGCCTARGVPEG